MAAWEVGAEGVCFIVLWYLLVKCRMGEGLGECYSVTVMVTTAEQDSSVGVPYCAAATAMRADAMMENFILIGWWVG